MRTNKEQEGDDTTRPKKVSSSDEALFGLLSSAANDDDAPDNWFAGLAQSHIEAARLRRKRLVFSAMVGATVLAGMWMMFAD